MKKDAVRIWRTGTAIVEVIPEMDDRKVAHAFNMIEDVCLEPGMKLECEIVHLGEDESEIVTIKLIDDDDTSSHDDDPDDEEIYYYMGVSHLKDAIGERWDVFTIIDILSIE